MKIQPIIALQHYIITALIQSVRVPTKEVYREIDGLVKLIIEEREKRIKNREQREKMKNSIH
ncbi:MAG: hypothetical protein N4A35_10190 [Flavobacteriales bacterium]|nr:hypothetical protein [Flavobacteriales bacterium]